MVKSPIIIVIEIILGLLATTLQTILFLMQKLVELFISLAYLASINPIGFIVATFIGAICLYFILKLIFKQSKFLFLILGFFILFLVTILTIAFLIG